MSATTMLPDCLAMALARAGEAAVRTAGPGWLREHLDAALAGVLDETALEQLCTELDRFGQMLQNR